MNAIAYAHDNREEALDQLKELLRIPSVSTLSEHKEDVQRAAQWLKAELERIGMENVAIEPTEGHPIVYADWLHASGAPTVLIYGHYDVQPPDPLSEWHSAPFEPTERDGKLYARGAADDKGQLFVHIKALEALMQTEGRLPVNVKILLEGEEEIGSAHLDPWIQANLERLRADVAVVSDSHILNEQQPTIVYGLRGLAYLEVHVETSRGDLHSGAYGGAVHNPIQALCEIVAQLHDENGTITVPGFYDKVLLLDEAERAEMARVPYTEETLLEETGAPQAWGEREYSVVERISARPTLELNGIWGGFAGEGAKTVLPARAGAKISMRLVPNQDPHEISRIVREHIERLAPPTVRITVREMHAGHGAIVPRDIPPMKAASEAYEEVFGARPIFVREGGSIPVVATFQKDLGMPTVLMGFGLPDDNLHAPNEKFNISMFYRGIETAILFYQKLGR
jgi:acetylornithine deacetylase/succinyl-diaminopimelate desuccinylase-like protein